MKILLLTLILSFSCLAQVHTRYDKFKDITFVESSFSLLKPTNGSSVGLTVLSSFSGEKLTKSESFLLMCFSSRSSSWRFLGGRNELTFLIDGERISFGKADHKGDIETRGVSERLYFTLSAAAAKRIAEGKSVEFQLGGVEGRFADEQRALFRDVLTAVTMPK